MRLWVGASGRIHLRSTCSGTSRNRGKWKTFTQEQLHSIWLEAVNEKRDPSNVICPCARHRAQREN